MSLSYLDIGIIILYLGLMVVVGLWFSRRNTSSDQFTKASGKIPGWAIGISLYATFLSSNTFLGVPGKAYGSNWNSFTFSLAMPIAAWIATKYFVPFYRKMGGVSAYSHLEDRFGAWARVYAVICFLFIQIVRIGSVFFGIALSLQALTGYSMASIMIITGICIVAYTVLGGIEAVIWTEVVQAVIKTLGAFLIIYLVVTKLPHGINDIIQIGRANHKFSLGTFLPDFRSSSFWVVLLYGIFMNMKAFGFDQNYVQRYHATPTQREAVRSVWICVLIYLPVSLLFFFIGTSLYTFYQLNPGLIESVKIHAATERLSATATAAQVHALANTLSPADYGDKVMPHFMVTVLPAGILGLIISAILSAGMSTISSGMNASATVFVEDIYKRYIRPEVKGAQQMKLLYISTTILGLSGMGIGVAMIGVKSILDLWWELSGIFAGGMFGLFVLGLLSKKTTQSEAMPAVVAGVLIILWMSLSYLIPDRYAFLRSPLNTNMVIVVGTLVIFFTGKLLTWLKEKVFRKERTPF